MGDKPYKVVKENNGTHYTVQYNGRSVGPNYWSEADAKRAAKLHNKSYQAAVNRKK